MDRWGSGCSPVLVRSSCVLHCLQSPAKALSSKKSSILSRIRTTDFQSSTKIEALREEVHKMLQADPSAKAIVFSQFTSMLDLVSFRLEQVAAHLTMLWLMSKSLHLYAGWYFLQTGAVTMVVMPDSSHCACFPSHVSM